MQPAPDSPLDRFLYRSSVVTIAEFRCPADHPSFADSGPTSAHLVAFPRTAVTIRHAGGEPLFVDPTVATLYNRGQLYTRSRVHPDGDASEWFAISEEALRGIVSELDAAAADRPLPIAHGHGPVASRLYLLQRLVSDAARNGTLDALEIEEAALEIVAEVLRAAYAARSTAAGGRRASTDRAHREAIDTVREALAVAPEESLTLGEASRLACLSPYHLSRVFRQRTGQTLSRYRNSVRLRYALERVLESDEDLTRAALAAGFSSHSHFTNRFRERFGAPPSAVRREQAGELLRRIRTSVQAA